MVTLLVFLGVDGKMIATFLGKGAKSSAPQSRSRLVLVLLCLCGAWCAWATYRIQTNPPFDQSKDFEVVSDKTFRNEEVVLDGREFRRCTFENVTYVFTGRQGFGIAGCNFNGSRIFKTTNPTVLATVLLLKGLGILAPDIPFYSDKPLPLVESPVDRTKH